MRTMSLSDTALYIVHYAKKMLKNPTKLGFFETPNLEVSSSSSSLSSSISSSSLSSLTDISDNPVVLVDETTNITQATVDKQNIPFVKSVKKSNITENNIDEIMLCQIPGISSQIAKSIISHFGSLQNMFLQYSVEGESILSNILISRKNSSECKLNKTVIKNILKYLFKK